MYKRKDNEASVADQQGRSVLLVKPRKVCTYGCLRTEIVDNKDFVARFIKLRLRESKNNYIYLQHITLLLQCLNAYKQKIRTGSPTLPPVFEDQFASVFAIAANGNTAKTTSEFDFIFKAKDVPEQLVLRRLRGSSITLNLHCTAY